ncbi:MFS transporter [Actinoplanes sp. CA-015351]|uniref:MFS transporter n=1 Tax=Actinoplanes sp. CA-015351 TaxID=3239897 RepID=UPI003D96E86F
MIRQRRDWRLLVVFLVREVGVNPGVVGGLIAAISCGGVVGAVVATQLARRIGTARAMLICEGASVPFGSVIPMTGPGAGLTLLAVGGLVIGIGVVAGNVVKGAFRQQYTPPELLGRTLVSMQFLNLGAVPVGALIAGSLASALGVRPALWCMTSGLALSGLILLSGPMKSRRDLPATPNALSLTPPG